MPILRRRTKFTMTAKVPRRKYVKAMYKKTQRRMGPGYRRSKASVAIASVPGTAIHRPWANLNNCIQFPTRMPFSLPYTDAAFTLTSGAAGVGSASKVYRLNSPYDPDFSGVGNSAEYFSELAVLYSRYMVTDVEICVVFANASSGTAQVHALIQPTAVTYDPAGKTADIIKMNIGSEAEIMGPSTGSNNILTLKRRISIAQLDGLTQAQFMSQIEAGGYSGAFGGNPTLNPWLRVGISDYLGNAGTTVAVQVSITMNGFAFERVQN